jgi:hypothetical protein
MFNHLINKLSLVSRTLLASLYGNVLLLQALEHYGF